MYFFSALLSLQRRHFQTQLLLRRKLRPRVGGAGDVFKVAPLSEAELQFYLGCSGHCGEAAMVPRKPSLG